MDDTNTVDQLLKQAQLRHTPVRARVLMLLLEAKRPLSVPDILRAMAQRSIAVTVYRTLGTLVEKGVVHRVRSEDRTWRYAMGDTKSPHTHHHPHFICEECGKVQCLKQIELPAGFVASLHLDKRYTIDYSEVMLHGVCPNCR